MFYPLYHLESINIIRAFCFHIPQVEGPRTPEEMITILQRVVEECATQLVAARIEAEERLNNQRLREEQDAAYTAALEADQVSIAIWAVSILIFSVT
jgi:hypothetical protein